MRDAYRKLLGLAPVQEYPAKAILLCALPEHGKTTRMQLEVAKDVMSQAEERFMPWPLPRKFAPPPIRVYDPKKEIGAISYKALMKSHEQTGEARYEEAAIKFKALLGNKQLDDFKEFQYYDTAGEAAAASLEDMRGLLIIEELLTVDPSDYSVITKAMAIRRTSTEGNGLTIYATTQRPKIMPVAMRAIPDEIWMGRIIEPIDIDALRPVIGPAKSAKLPHVQRGEWEVYRQGEAHEPA